MLAVAAGLATLFVAGLIVHVVPLLGEAGLDRQQALILTTILGGGAFVGRLLAGYILDRRDARLFGAVAFLLPALAFAGFAVFDLTMPVATVLVLLFALGSGAELEVASYLTARYFNLANFGARFGMVTFATGLGTGGGPPLAGWIFDRWGTYEPWLVVAPFVFALCSALILCLPSQPNVER
jgi:MFS family permease